jgi:RNA polymerase sigma-70 factor, ECF subfamily
MDAHYSHGADGPVARTVTLDESGLLAALCSGDNDAYELLVREHSARLLAVARRILGNDEDAKDTLQDAFVSAFRAIHAFEGTARLSTWLHRIVVNVALMKLRSRRRKPETLIDDLLPAFHEDGHHVEAFAAWTDTAEALLQRAETRQQVRAAIDRLPETYRLVLVLRDIEELDTREAAAALGITPNAVKIRLHRARQALRTLLDPHFRRDA